MELSLQQSTNIKTHANPSLLNIAFSSPDVNSHSMNHSTSPSLASVHQRAKQQCFCSPDDAPLILRAHANLGLLLKLLCRFT